MTGGAVVWLAGVDWDGPPGTDRRLVPELAALRPVLWVDPPASVFGAGPVDERPVAGVVRRRPISLPGMTRPGSRVVASARAGAAARALARAHGPVAATVVARPLATFPRGVGGARILFATDDWIAGAALMGLDRRAVERDLRSALRAADAVVAVSPALLDLLDGIGVARPEATRLVLPNGAPAVTVGAGSEPVAVLVGQLNERLDLAALEAVLAAGVAIRVYGRVVAREETVRSRLEALLAHERVEWRGAVAPEVLAAELPTAAVGLTPYTDTPFNRASSPLKTWDYLAAGLPVVSTDLSASRWIDSCEVLVATDAVDFADKARAQIDRAAAVGRADEPHRLATAHSWVHRAAAMDRLIGAVATTRPTPVGSARG
ncbi:glycosyltransferase [Pseudolysinimonas sp.]|uniref:glycosyltransferase n=1 Tax=Pseudolysinimonas sp. TaxID=2680009 RepID=UPI003F81268E